MGQGDIMLTPMDIHNKEFKRSFRGYNEDEIDDFLDQVVNDYERLYRENERLKNEVAQQKESLAQYQKLEKNLKDTLLVAQKTAEEVTTNARENAEQQLANAAKECQNMRRETELSAEKVKAETDAKIKEKIASATDQLHAIISEYDRLSHEKGKFLQRMQRMLEDELDTVKGNIEHLPHHMTPQPAPQAQPAPQTEPPAAKADSQKAAAQAPASDDDQAKGLREAVRKNGQQAGGAQHAPQGG